MPDARPNSYGPSLRQTLSEPLSSLRLLGRRALLALLGIAAGCASVVALLNIGHNAAHEAIRTFKGLGSDVMVGSFTATPDTVTRPAPAALDTQLVKHAVPGLREIAPAILYSTTVHIGGQAYPLSVIGTSHELEGVLGLQLSHGRFLSPYDQQSTYAVLGAQAARALNVSTLNNQDPVAIEGYLFEIIGILAEHGHNPLIPIPVDEAILLPIEGMRRITPTPEINSIIAKGLQSERLAEDANALRDYLAPKAPGHTVQVQIPQQLLDGLERQARTFSYLLLGLAGISLLVGGVGIMNVMVMNVSERRQEIGIRMAIGARPRDIASLFLLEAMALAVVGALAGALFGVAAAWMFVTLSGWSFSLSMTSLPLGIASSLLSTLVFGLHPAQRAAALQPVTALRDD
ncbi:ABC transporter permease [Pseudomonas sp. HLS-6]|jgi:putative ABC transport system permease protein|uniref:ABC transporter permease n=1 Tax=Pseudomonas sp. HLS-6 TaxID=2049589 RepID=UPI000C17E395|nr:ABC transporter permease [Pseudomonas sp. HLS-6]ATR82211.1 ABC transporter permease [Pseudomonas sp. HLS-6]